MKSGLSFPDIRKWFFLIVASLLAKGLFAQAPVITSFFPMSGPIGTNVTITGMNFSSVPGSNIVYFGAVKAIVTAATNTSLTVKAPAGATYDHLTVTVNNLTAYSARPFVIIFAGGGPLTYESFRSAGYLYQKGSGDNTHKTAVGDLDGDGLVDIVSTNPKADQQNISVFRNLGNGFATSVSLEKGYRPSAAFCKDIDGDGKLDIVATNDDSSISIYKNFSTPGSISFQRKLIYKVPGFIWPYQVKITDLDGDGKPDIAFRTISGYNLFVVRNTTANNVISFSSAVKSFSVNSNSFQIVAADFDGDGKADLATGGPLSISLMRNTSTVGNISFTTTELQTGSEAIFVETGDFDNDGKTDLAVARLGSPYVVSIFKNQSNPGSISFQNVFNATINSRPAIGPAIGDLNGDGKPDIGIGTQAGFDRVFLLENTGSNGDISFASPVPYISNDLSFGEKIVFGDLNNDGKSEMIIPNPSTSTIALTRNQIEGYYSKDTGKLNVLTTWGVNPDGSGSAPLNFGAGKTFNLSNRSQYALTGDWTVGGTINIPAGKFFSIGQYNTLYAYAFAGGGYLASNRYSNLVINNSTATGTYNLPFINSDDFVGQVNDLTINIPDAQTITGKLHVFGALNITRGTLKIDRLLVLKSDAYNTARVGPLQAGVSSIIGTVSVERFIPARSAWRLLSAPVSLDQNIFNSWQMGVTPASPNPNPVPRYGIQINGGTVANGFDNPGSCTIKRYHSDIDSWQPIDNTNQWKVGQHAWMVFVNGDKIVNPAEQGGVKSTTLLATGTLRTGDQTFSVSASGYTAVPNPFPSPVNFAAITRNNVQNSFYLWDPKMAGTYGVGAYVNVSWNGTSYDVTPASVSPESQYIQSGQGFLVHSTGVAGSLIIKESDKSATPSANVFRSATNATKGLRVTLQAIDKDNTAQVVDEVYSAFSNNYTDEINDLDVVKLTNPNENIAIARNSNALMVDRRSEIKGEEVIQLKIWNAEKKSYQLEINPSNLSSSLQSATLEDSYLHTSTIISLNAVSQYHFAVSEDAASQNPYRFKLIFNKKTSATPAIAEGKEGIRVYPNPVTGKTINVEFSDKPKGNYTIELINAKGQELLMKSVYNEGGKWIKTIQLDGILLKGIYTLQVSNGEEKSTLSILRN